MSDIFTRPYVTSLCINTLQRTKILYLPAASTVSRGTMLYIKDICGNATVSSIILSTTGYFDTIDNKASFTSTTSNILPPSYSVLSTNFCSAMLIPDGNTNWMTIQNKDSKPISIFSRSGYTSSFLYSYFYSLGGTGSANLSNGAPITSPLGPGNQGWAYPFLTSNVSTFNYINFNPPGNPGGGGLNWGLASKGYIYASTATTIQFRIVADDGMVVYLNRSTVISCWPAGGGAFTCNSVPIPLNEGYNPFAMTFYQGASQSRATLSWSIPAAGTFPAQGRYLSSGGNIFFYNESSKFWDEPLL